MFQNLARTLMLLVIILTLAGGNVQAAGGGYLYALRNVNAAQNQIFGFQVNEFTGALTLLPGFPVNTGGTGSANTASEQLVYDPANGRLFALNEGSNTVSAYTVDLTTGGLTGLPFSPFNLGSGNWKCLAVHPGGSPLVAGDSDGNFLVSFNITAGSAAAAAGSPFATGTGSPSSCAFSRDGQYVYTGGAAGNNIAGFKVNTGTGVLTALPGSPLNSGNTFPLAYATDNAGRLFLSNFNSNQVRVFTTNSGLPIPGLNNPFVSGLTEGVQGLLHPAGFYLVADQSGNQVGVYRIDGAGPSTTLTAVAGSPFVSGGTHTAALALNQSGAYLFVANGDSRNITTFTINTGTGALTSPVTQPLNTLGPDGRITGLTYAARPQPPDPLGAGFVYTLEDRSGVENRIHGFRVNEFTGALTPLGGFPLGTGGIGIVIDAFQRMAYDEKNGRLYVLNNGSKTVSAYRVDRATGSLTSLPFSPIALGADNWYCVAVSPDGSTLVTGALSEGTLASFHITGDSAVAAAGSPYATGAKPASCAFSQDGAYVYASGNFGKIAGYSVDGDTAVLTALPGSPFDSGNVDPPLALATDQAGRLFLAHYNIDQLRVFTTSGGVISPVTGNPFAKGLGAFSPHGLLHPAGYYLVAGRVTNKVGVYRIAGSGSDTTLTAVAGSPFTAGGTSTSILALNQSRAFLFAANGASNNITTFSFDPSTGVLDGLYIQPGVSASSILGRIDGMAYVPGLNHLFLPLIQQ